MKFSRLGFLKALTGGSAAIPILHAARGKDAAATVDIPPADSPTTERLRVDWGDFFDIRDAVVYDRVHFGGPVIPACFNLFASGLGGRCEHTGGLKTLAYTNMEMPGSFPMPTQFWAKRLKLVVDPGTLGRDARTFGEYGWELQLGHKIFAGGSCMVDQTYGRVEDILNMRWPKNPARKSMDFEFTGGLLFPTQQYFTVRFMSDRSHDLERGGNGLDLAFVMEGLICRPVQ